MIERTGSDKAWYQFTRRKEQTMTNGKNNRVSAEPVRRPWAGWRHGVRVSVLLLLLAVLVMQGCITATAVAIIAATTGAGHTATVEVEKTPQEVYGAMLRIVNEDPDIKLESRDDAKYCLKASRGKNRVEGCAKLLDNGMTELVVKATAREKGRTYEDLALKSVQRVCSELDVPYKVVQKKEKKKK